MTKCKKAFHILLSKERDSRAAGKANQFADSCLLDVASVEKGIWPCTDKGHPLVFEPHVVFDKLAPAARLQKHVLVTAFIEYCRAVHCLWEWEQKESDAQDPISVMRLYIAEIESRFGQPEMLWAVRQAAVGAPSAQRLIDLAADGIGGWVS